jgi:hypothetical protein
VSEAITEGVFVIPQHIMQDKGQTTLPRNLNIDTVIGVEYTFIKEKYLFL